MSHFATACNVPTSCSAAAPRQNHVSSADLVGGAKPPTPSNITQQITLSPHHSAHPSGNYTLPPARHPTPFLQTPTGSAILRPLPARKSHRHPHQVRLVSNTLPSQQSVTHLPAQSLLLYRLYHERVSTQHYSPEVALASRRYSPLQTECASSGKHQPQLPRLRSQDHDHYTCLQYQSHHTTENYHPRQQERGSSASG
jgi:hypothetical protein